MIAAVVAREARLADLSGRHLSEFLDVPFRVVVDVSLTGTVAAFAALRRGGSARILHLRMLCALQRFFLVGVARQAGVAAGIAGLSRGGCRLTGRCLQGSGGTRRDGAPGTDRERSSHNADRNCRFHRSAIRKLARS